MSNTEDKLVKFYSQKSKHSNYQVLPSSLQKLLGQNNIETRSRFERERLNFMLKHVNVQDSSILDIGGNTGFFIFELIDKGAKKAHLYEGNKDHCDFVSLAADALGLQNIAVTNKYYTFGGEPDEEYDVALLLNVLHHIGDDYDNKNLAIEDAKKKIIKQLNTMSKVAKTLVFQLGFNWHGNPNTCLFKEGTKKEMIDFIQQGCSDYWEFTAIGIAKKNGDEVFYEELNDDNIERDDSLGEFLNRPIFILNSKSME